MASCYVCKRSRSSINRKKGFSFHRFPKVEVVRQQWMDFVEQNGGEITNVKPESVLCSGHFENDRILQYVSSRTLKENTIPTIVINRQKQKNMSQLSLIRCGDDGGGIGKLIMLAEVSLVYFNDCAEQSTGRTQADAVPAKTTVSKPKPTNARRYQCSECDKYYATSSNLCRHRRLHHYLIATDIRCPNCDKFYASEAAFKLYVRMHYPANTCPFCDRSFSRWWSKKLHLQKHTGEKPYVCLVCSRAFADKSALRCHEQQLHHCRVLDRCLSVAQNTVV